MEITKMIPVYFYFNIFKTLLLTVKKRQQKKNSGEKNKQFPHYLR